MRLTAFALLAAALLAPAPSPPPAAEAPPSASPPELTLERLFADPPLSGSSLRSLTVSPDGRRVAFLRGRPDDARRLDLWQHEVATGTTRLLVDSALPAPGVQRLSELERSQRERKRTAAFSGIVQYQWAPDGGSVLFPFGGEISLRDLRQEGPAALRRLTRGGFATDAAVSPRGGFASFVRDQNLWLVDLASGREVQLTRDGGGPVTYGVAEPVAAEEMDRHLGHWWAPDDSAIALARVDESRVPVRRRLEVHAERADVVEQRYPAAGEPNATVELRLVRVAEALAGAAAPELRRVDLGPDPDVYLARVDWLDADRLSFQRQGRDQKRLDLVLHDLRDGSQRILVTETSPAWVSLHDDLRFLKRRPAFVWSSERSGLRQLFLLGLDGRLVRQLTSAPWPVDEVLAVDEAAGRVLFTAPGPDVLEKHVFSVSLDRPGEPERLTSPGAFHKAVASEDGRVFLDTASSPERPPRVDLRDGRGRHLAVLEGNALDASHPYHPYLPRHRLPEFGTVTGSEGQVLHYRLLRPDPATAPARVPVLVRVYGGPGAQTVTRSWGSLWDQYLAARGFAVFALDNRGSPRRGRAFEDAISGRLGEAEVRDQLEGVRWLRSQPWVDPARIAVQGWSYGGYMVVQLLAQGEGAFAAGVAVAPVTDWRLYDTHYTERYLGPPATNPDAYERASVFPHLDGWRGRLLLVHGMADDNVLFAHSTRFMSELQKRGVEFDLMTYPGSKHGIAGKELQTHLHRTMTSFLERALSPVPR